VPAIRQRSQLCVDLRLQLVAQHPQYAAPRPPSVSVGSITGVYSEVRSALFSGRSRSPPEGARLRGGVDRPLDPPRLAPVRGGGIEEVLARPDVGSPGRRARGFSSSLAAGRPRPAGCCSRSSRRTRARRSRPSRGGEEVGIDVQRLARLDDEVLPTAVDRPLEQRLELGAPIDRQRQTPGVEIALVASSPEVQLNGGREPRKVIALGSGPGSAPAAREGRRRETAPRRGDSAHVSGHNLCP